MSTEKKMLSLKSSDEETFDVEETAALEMETIKNMIEDGCADSVIPVPNVTGTILAKVIEYCKKQVEARAKATSEGSAGTGVNKDEDDLEKWNADFVMVDPNTLYDLLMAANFLNMKGLLGLACQRVANMIQGKSPEEIRKTFGIKNDFSEEEEDEIRRENQWAFD